MRVAIVRRNVAHAGGAETYADAVTAGLCERGHEVGVWYETGQPAGGADPLRRWYGAMGEGDALQALAAWRPDVLFVQGLRSTALEAQLLSLAPAVLFAHGYAGLCISGTRLHSCPGMTPCTRTFGAACLALYFPRRCGGWDPRTAIAEYRLQSARLRLISRYHRVVVASEYMAAEYARHGLGQRVTVIGLPLRAPSPARRVASEYRELLYCGRFESTKGPDIAVHAAARVAERLSSPVRLTLAGIGRLDERLRADAARLSARVRNFHVRFTGWVNDSERDELFRQADLLLVPSRWPEPFGLVGIEAGIRGVPSVAFDVGGIREWLDDGRNGRLIPTSAFPARSLADATIDCLRLEPARFELLREGARQNSSRFSLRLHLDRLETVFGQALEGTP